MQSVVESERSDSTFSFGILFKVRGDTVGNVDFVELFEGNMQKIGEIVIS